MADAIENLIEEHRLIEHLLGSLEAFSERVGQAPESDRGTVRDFADFFHQLVDRMHHGKEEQYLFVRLGAYGFSNQVGPVSAMLSEQGEGREHLSALKTIGQGTGPLSQREQTLVKGHALGYITRILSHMKREDEILFPVARHVLPSFVMQELTAEFNRFDTSAGNRPTYERLSRLAKKLSENYPPKPGISAASAGHIGSVRTE